MPKKSARGTLDRVCIQSSLLYFYITTETGNLLAKHLEISNYCKREPEDENQTFLSKDHAVSLSSTLFRIASNHRQWNIRHIRRQHFFFSNFFFKTNEKANSY